MRKDFLLCIVIAFACISLTAFGQTSLDVDEIIRKAKEHFTDKLQDTPYLVKGYYVETAKSNGNYEVFMDGLGYSVYLGEKYNYAPLMRYRFFHENTRMLIGNPDPSTTSLYGHHKYIVPNSFRPLVVHLMFKSGGPLTKVKDYTFKLEDSHQSDYYLISFVAIADDPTLTPNGQLKINKNTYQLTSVTHQTADKKLTNGKYPDSEVTLEYIYLNEEPFLSRSLIIHDYQGDVEHQIEYRMINQEIDYHKVSKKEFIALNALTLNPFIQFNEQEWVQATDIPYPDYVESAIQEIGGFDLLHSSSAALSGKWISGPGSNDFYYHKTWEDKIAAVSEIETP